MYPVCDVAVWNAKNTAPTTITSTMTVGDEGKWFVPGNAQMGE